MQGALQSPPNARVPEQAAHQTAEGKVASVAKATSSMARLSGAQSQRRREARERACQSVDGGIRSTRFARRERSKVTIGEARTCHGEELCSRLAAVLVGPVAYGSRARLCSGQNRR